MGADSVLHQAELITSPANPTIKLARSLHRKRVRYRERALLVEGVRAIRTAHDLGVQIRALIVDASRQSELDPAQVATLTGAAGRTLLVDPPLFNQITDTEHPQPLVAICTMPESPLPGDCSFVIALDGVRDPGNLGTLVRSAAGAGADGVALLHGSADPFNPKVVRSSVGTIFALPVRSFSDIPAILSGCFQTKPRVIIADSDGERPYDAVDWTAPVLAIIGGEAEGTGEEVRTYADEIVAIPMAPEIESLNAAVAGSIIAFEVARQRRRRS